MLRLVVCYSYVSNLLISACIYAHRPTGVWGAACDIYLRDIVGVLWMVLPHVEYIGTFDGRLGLNRLLHVSDEGARQHVRTYIPVCVSIYSSSSSRHASLIYVVVREHPGSISGLPAWV